MPDRRRHRGAAPEDQRIFDDRHVGPMAEAAEHLAWLLTRGYADKSALKLVGDRRQLHARQRIAVMRAACSHQSRAARRAREIAPAEVAEQSRITTTSAHRDRERTIARPALPPPPREGLLIDGHNVVTLIEAALGGAPIVLGQDGCLRDLSGLHGTWRRVEETVPAIIAVGHHLASVGVNNARWLLDQPVSNSGRLKAAILHVAREHGWANWSVEVVPDPDWLLIRATGGVIATGDSVVLDRSARPWYNLARHIVRKDAARTWLLDLSTPPDPRPDPAGV